LDLLSVISAFLSVALTLLSVALSSIRRFDLSFRRFGSSIRRFDLSFRRSAFYPSLRHFGSSSIALPLPSVTSTFLSVALPLLSALCLFYPSLDLSFRRSVFHPRFEHLIRLNLKKGLPHN